MRAKLSRVRLRVISTNPNWVKPLTVVLVRSRASCLRSSVNTDWR